MRFVKSDSEGAAAYIADVVREKLGAGKRVLLFLSGGSAIAVAVALTEKLRGTPSVRLLTITLMDERYGEVGHADSNWQQLLDAGFMLPGATLLPILRGGDMTATADAFANAITEQLEAADYRIGLFGIGPDGHTAGILPYTSAVTETDMVHAYEAGGYRRITLAVPALTWLDEAIVYAMGEAKWPVLAQLKTDLPVDDQPAQLLKTIPALTIFNDHLEETV
jgi:6-phosphogluconolactonase/glucosamine-6-phosphate isomerase/deaminase